PKRSQPISQIFRAHVVLWTIGYGQPRLTKTHTTRASQPTTCSHRVQMGQGVRKSHMIWVGRGDILVRAF
ncbi:hypothetical protein PAXRUDRAFT_835987, partial [Paxillus rubicundulus Ve08.2h10]